MDDETLVKELKSRLAITDNYHDAMLLAFANDTKDYLKAGGVSAELLESEKALGILTRGVIDLWNNTPSGGSFSPLFLQRAIQLIAESEESES